MKRMLERLGKLARCAAELLSLIVFTPLGRLARLILPRYRRVWLIAERGREARDNAYHFFRYMRAEHPEINAWYMIDKRSADLARVAPLGPVVYRNGLRHRLLMGAAERLISTHIMGYTPDMGAYFRLDYLRLVPGIKVFLQHGIIKDNMPFMHYPKTRADLFVVSARPEYEYIRRTYGHRDGVVQLLGLCRFDALHRAPKPDKRQILLMPTWREWLALHDAGDFTQTAYYRALQGLLESPRLAELLEAYDCTLAFYPHYEMQRFLDKFHTACGRVSILSFAGSDVQTLLIESAVLLTDFSSVFFDFGYMGKPSLFYQFDEEEFRRRQYKEGYFSYRRDGFGPVETTLEGTLDALERILRDGPAPEYARRMDAFFERRDDGNCERNYRAILALDHRLE